MMSRKRTDRSSWSGFSLAEIMIVVAILAMGALLAIPFIRRNRSEYDMDRAVSRLVAELRAARTYARSGSRPVVVSIDTTARTLTVQIDRNDNGILAVDEQSTVTITTKNGIAVSSPVTTGTFDPRGGFSCPQSYWSIAISSASEGIEYVYVFTGGQIQRSREVL